MKFLLIAALTVLSSTAFADRVCTDIPEALDSSGIVNNPSGSVTIDKPLFEFRGSLYRVSATNGASALCAMFGKKVFKSKSYVSSDNRIAQFLADGSFVDAADYRTGKVISTVICK